MIIIKKMYAAQPEGVIEENFLLFFKRNQKKKERRKKGLDIVMGGVMEGNLYTRRKCFLFSNPNILFCTFFPQ
jgi:hypothetical protein